MAGYLPDAALALIEDGQWVIDLGSKTLLPLCFVIRYGEEVENYLDCSFKTPGLPKEDVEKALFARGNARKSSAERLFAKAQQGYFAVVMLRPADTED